MLTPPADLDAGTLAAALAGWGLAEASLEYLPVGFGSHHWHAAHPGAAPAFVTVDDLVAGFQGGKGADGAFDGLRRAYGTAAALRDDGALEFVLAPVADAEGILLRRIDDRYAVSVTPFVEGRSSSFGAYESRAERREVAALVGRLHAATAAVPAGLPRREDWTLPSREVLVGALAALERPWETGPFADGARALLTARADDLRRRLREYDALAARVGRSPRRSVATHGEPHRANVLVDLAGRRHLVDWDTTLLAPPERDLWHVLDDELTGWGEYVRVAGPAELDRDALELYRERWELADIAGFVADLRRPHAQDENAAAAFRFLIGYLTA